MAFRVIRVTADNKLEDVKGTHSSEKSARESIDRLIEKSTNSQEPDNFIIFDNNPELPKLTYVATDNKQINESQKFYIVDFTMDHADLTKKDRQEERLKNILTNQEFRKKSAREFAQRTASAILLLPFIGAGKINEQLFANIIIYLRQLCIFTDSYFVLKNIDSEQVVFQSYYSEDKVIDFEDNAIFENPNSSASFAETDEFYSLKYDPDTKTYKRPEGFEFEEEKAKLPEPKFYYAKISHAQFSKIIKYGSHLTFQQLSNQLDSKQLIPIKKNEFHNQVIEKLAKENFRGVLLKIKDNGIDANPTIHFSEKLETNQPYKWRELKAGNIFLQQEQTSDVHYLGDNNKDEILHEDILTKYLPKREQNFVVAKDKWNLVKVTETNLQPLNERFIYQKANSNNEAAKHENVIININSALEEFAKLNNFDYLRLHTQACKAIKTFESVLAKTTKQFEMDYVNNVADKICDAIVKTNKYLQLYHQAAVNNFENNDNNQNNQDNPSQLYQDALKAIQALGNIPGNKYGMINVITESIKVGLLGVIAGALLYGLVYGIVGGTLSFGVAAIPMFFVGVMHGMIQGLLLQAPLWTAAMGAYGGAGALLTGVGMFGAKTEFWQNKNSIAVELYDALGPAPAPNP